MNKKRNRNNKESKNFQDESMDQEYNKGYRAGNSNKRYRNNNKNSRSSSRPIDRGGSKINDPNWNAPTAQILKDANSLPFSHVVGNPYTLAYVNNLPNNATYDYYKVPSYYYVEDPGIMRITLMSSLGNPTTTAAPVTTAGNAIYAFVRHMNSGARNYDAPDMILYIFCMSEAYAFYSWMCRLYGIVSYYQFYNRYVPTDLVNSMGVKFDELSSNLANFRLLINQFGYKLQSFCIPSGIDYVDRHQMLYRDVYTDADSTKAQLYFFNPGGFYIWYEGTASGPGYARYSPITLTYNTSPDGGENAILPMTLSQLEAYATAMLAPLNGSEDFNMMSGDILKAFGANGIYKINPIDEKYFVTPTYSKEILSEIENSMPAFSNLWNSGNGVQGRITHDPTINGGRIIEDTYFYCNSFVKSDFVANHPSAAAYRSTEVSAASCLSSCVLNLHTNDPTPADVTVATNLKHGGIYQYTGNIPNWVNQPPAGTQGNPVPYKVMNNRAEICIQAEILTYRSTGSGTILTAIPFSWDNPTLMVVTSSNGTPAVAKSVIASSYAVTNTIEYAIQSLNEMNNLITAFDWSPMVFPTFGIWGRQSPDSVDQDNTNSINVSKLAPICDLDNVTYIDTGTLRSMHESALLGLLSCRNMGGFTLK